MNTTKLQDLRIENAPQTLREIVLERLRSAIISGRFKSGERLVERVLCDQLGVSRSIVREAICFLEADGLVEIAPRSGPIVARMDWPQAKQIYDIRLQLEAQAATECARKADAVAKAALKSALRGLQDAFSQADGDEKKQAIYAATTHFYQVIFSTAEHDVAWEIVSRLNARISRLRAMTLATTDRPVSGLIRMSEICEALLANDPQRAAQAVHDHLIEATAIARRLLKSETQQSGAS
ncbi:GntR family transcriptional regulator [Pseudorhodobacter sp. W20_MBD10_FR17]|uniref:GntR family transcriptional regulator n=1 Tax=Pseudorhodobacter sp. W20_MBD10_FR17 TaxID=3240266 RepID=UPI003F9BD701